MLEKLRGTLAVQAYKHFNRVPDQATQLAMQKEGWAFQSVRASDAESPGDPNMNVIIHPDGKPLDGMHAPGVVHGSDGNIIPKEAKPLLDKRFHDYSIAVARAKLSVKPH